MSITAEAAGCLTRFDERQFTMLSSPARMLSDSALVQVTELTSDIVNPTPRHPGSSDDFIDEYIGERKLKDLTGTDDLASINFLEIRIDVNMISCANFGSLLPNLRELRLIKSNVPALRDLGSSLDTLEILWMPRSCLQCLDGLSSMSNLVELYLAFNELREISACAMLELLEVLDLEGNQILEKSNIAYLKVCANLTNLTLEGNPIVSEMGGIKKYRTTVRKALPQLRKLDDIPVENDSAPKSSEYDINKFDNEWNYINTLLREVGLISGTSSANGPTRIGASSNLADESVRPDARPEEEPMKPGRVGSGLRPVSGQIRLSTATEYRRASPISPSSRAGSRPATANSCAMNEISENEETTSGLTTGQVVCGGIGGALRSRRGSGTTSRLNSTATAAPGSSGAVTCRRSDLNEINIPSSDNLDPSVPRSNITALKIGRLLNTASCGKQPVKLNQKNKKDKKISRTHKSIDPNSTDIILQEEEQLRLECDAVLKELAAWRKAYSESQVFRVRKSAPQVLKVQPDDKDTDAILFSTDSESTIEERSGASAGSSRSRRNAPPHSLTPGKQEPDSDEECPIDVRSHGAHETRPTGTAGADCTETSGELCVSEKPELHSGRSADAINGKAESTVQRASSTSLGPKPDKVARKKLSGQSSAFAETKSKTKISTDGLLPGQSSSLQTVQPALKRLGRPAFPPLAPISPYSVVHTTLKGSTDSHVVLDNHRPRLVSNLQPNASNGQFQTLGPDIRQATRKSPHVMPNASSSNRPGPKKLASRLETTGRLTSKLSGTTPSPLPSKPTVQPKA